MLNMNTKPIASTCCEAFNSAPIKLAARISECRRRNANTSVTNKHNKYTTQEQMKQQQHIVSKQTSGAHRLLASSLQVRQKCVLNSHLPILPTLLLLLVGATCFLLQLLDLRQLQIMLPCNALVTSDGANSQLLPSANSVADTSGEQRVRQHAHYMQIIPSAHFSYHEGRQMNARALDTGADVLHAPVLLTSGSHIHKRSSVVAPQHQQQSSSGELSARSSLDPLSRRMMATAAHANWLGVQSARRRSMPPSQLAVDGNQSSTRRRAALLVDDSTSSSSAIVDDLQQLASNSQISNYVLAPQRDSRSHYKKQTEREAELLRQKQHIQYHDQSWWPSSPPSATVKCHKRTLNFCASVLPFNSTTFPNIIGDTNRFEVKRSLPFFGFLAKSSCNKRLDELLCLLLEPPCGSSTGAAIPPCKKFCRLALEGCHEYIPATLALSSVFDCRQYPDSTDPSVCVNLAQGSRCATDEFKCPDKTCIPNNWLCDGVRDCIFAADEANCTASSQTSYVCSTEEFKCDGKCVPKVWKCDGERDCLDGSDEEQCDLRPKCAHDRFKCQDGNGCIPKRWVCDGKAECRDGSDEMQCEQRECSENDFKCDNGICIPKLWRCDRQADCKDGSDERSCAA